MDPNIRLIHDQFIRLYPKLSYLKMSHIQANAEFLPIKKNSFDVVLICSVSIRYLLPFELLFKLIIKDFLNVFLYLQVDH